MSARARVVVVVVAAAALGACPTVGPDGGVAGDDDGGATAPDGGAVDDGGVDAGVVPEPFPVIDPACATNGCLRALSPLGTVPRTVLEDLVEPGVVVETGYELSLATYLTDGRLARAVVAIPWPAVPPAAGYHVVVNNPGTVGLDDACALGDGVGGPGLAGTFAAYGFVGVSVDYPGLGTAGLHPYLVADVEGKASLDAARAAIAVARLYLVAISRRVAVVGLSQGGHATIAAAARHASYAPTLDVRAFAAAAPASVVLEQWAAGLVVDGPHLVYHALVTAAWSAHYGYLGPSLFADAIAADVPGWMSAACVFSLDGEPTLFDLFPTTAAAVFAPDYLAAFTAADLDGYPAIAQGFAENRLDAYAQTAPLLVYQGTADTTVTLEMTDALVARLVAGGVDVDYRVVEGAGHVDVAFNAVAFPQARGDEARAWIAAQLDAP